MRNAYILRMDADKRTLKMEINALKTKVNEGIWRSPNKSMFFVHTYLSQWLIFMVLKGQFINSTFEIWLALNEDVHKI